LVTNGEVFKNNGIKITGYVKQLPSRGISGIFNLRNFFKDFRDGLFNVLYQQIKFLKSLDEDFLFVAVGDIVPLLLLYFAGGLDKTFFVATAKSIRTEFFNPFEAWLMKKSIASFVRDHDSPQWILKTYKLKNVYYVGNPVLDIPIFEDNLTENLQNKKTILILPGRIDVCLDNLLKLRNSIEKLSEKFDDVVFVIIVPSFYPIDEMKNIFRSFNNCFVVDSLYYGALLRVGYVVWGFGGSANEQAAGFGLPVISFNQKNWYRNRQKKLLGKALILVDNESQLVNITEKLLTDENYRQEIGSLGKSMMGSRGGAQKIAQFIINYLSKN